MVTAAFTATPESPRAARRFVARTLDQWGRAELADTACLLTSELVTNAIEHARSPVHLVVEVDGEQHLRVEVHDVVATALAPRRPDLHDLRGRGLALVERLSDDWGVTPDPGGGGAGGKAVWFALA